MTKPLHITGSICLLAVACAAIWGAWQWKLTNESLRAAIGEGQWLISDARPEIRTLLNQAKLASFETRVTMKALGEEVNSREQQQARLATMRAGASVAALAARIEAETLPLLNQNLRSTDGAVIAARGLLENTDKALTADNGLLPESTRLLASVRATADAFQVDSKQLTAEILKLTQAGQVSMDSINAVLASSQWEQILRNVERSTGNIAATTAELPSVAKSVEKIAATSAKFSKAILIAQLIATVAGALF